MDVKTSFLNGEIEEEVYIEQPKGFETFDRESHVCQLKRALYGLKWTEGVKLQGFTDVDWVGSPSDRKSTSGRIFNLGSTAVSWYSGKQRSIALSTTEAEYMAASQAACEVIWMRKILVGLFGQMMDPTIIYCDNHGCTRLFENPVFHDMSKHIDIRYHHLRDCVVKRIMMLHYILTEE
eukprot:PITA_33740